MGTYVPGRDDIQPKWFVVDAGGQVLGRVATRVATLLRGKYRVEFAPFVDFGDHVIVLNAAKIRWTGKKLDQKLYRHYTGYPGGLKEMSARKLSETKPDRVIREAVLGMLPKNKLRKRMAARLLIYADDRHPHQAQKPEPVKLGAAK
ncbi:MAG: 50S ribosomal protein L13 [Acidobacteria bacterium]|nr:50S ribosomal protein L13 [Acidobacteriota bacterium]